MHITEYLVIGYEEADTQRNCHPLTSLKIGELELAREYAEKLKDDKFYKLCSEIEKIQRPIIVKNLS